MNIIRFKALRRASVTDSSYRGIAKSGDLQYDSESSSDDVIVLNVVGTIRIVIDCDKKTGEFTMRFDGGRVSEL